PLDQNHCASTSAATVAGRDDTSSIIRRTRTWGKAARERSPHPVRLMNRLRVLLPSDREHAPAIHTLQLYWLPRQCLAMATARADRVARTPTHWHVDRVPGAGHDGPLSRPQRHDLQRGPLEADGLPVHVEDHLFGRHPKHFIPRPATDVAIHLATHAGPLWCFGHRSARPLGFLHNMVSGRKNTTLDCSARNASAPFQVALIPRHGEYPTTMRARQLARKTADRRPTLAGGA